jgi:hypothetical protein
MFGEKYDCKLCETRIARFNRESAETNMKLDTRPW